MAMDDFLPGSASLVDLIDRKVLVVLRDGRKLYGWLRSYDQFGNLVLQDTIERIFIKGTAQELASGIHPPVGAFGECYHGLYIVRGENVVLMGTVDEEKEVQHLASLRYLPLPQAKEAYGVEREDVERTRESKSRLLRERGFCVEIPEGDAY